MNAVKFAERLGALDLTNAALVDCTVRTNDRRCVSGVHRGNLHIVTPNKWRTRCRGAATRR